MTERHATSQVERLAAVHRSCDERLRELPALARMQFVVLSLTSRLMRLPPAVASHPKAPVVRRLSCQPVSLSAARDDSASSNDSSSASRQAASDFVSVAQVISRSIRSYW